MEKPAPARPRVKPKASEENIFDLVNNGGARSASQQSLHRINLAAAKSKNHISRDRLAASKEDEIRMERNVGLARNSENRL